MAANSNVGSTNSGSSRRTSSSGGRAGSVASSLSKTLSAGSNAEVNSSETSSASFSCITTITSSGSEAAVAAPMETTGGSGGGLRRATSAGGKNKKRFVGVRQRPSGRWVAEIKDTTQKIRLWLGTFDTAEDAARAYDEAAWLLRGANTRTNFVPSTSTDASVLPSKAARLLQLRRNAAAATASSQENSSGAAATPVAAPATAPVNSKPPQIQSGTSAGNKLEGNVNPNSIESCPPKSPPLPSSVVVLPSPDSNSKQATSMGSRVPAPLALVTAASAASTSPYRSSSIGHVSDFSGEVSKSESSYESSVEEMCGIEEAPGFNNNGAALFQPDLGGSLRRNDQSTTIVNVKQELVTSTYQQPLAEPSPIRENRKEKDYCSEAPQQESFVDDTDMSSGLAGLQDVDLSCADSVYSSPFDFSADMGPGFLISSPLSADLATGEDDSLTEHMRRMSYERQISAGLYAINGVHECLSLSHSWGQSSWNGGLSSPSLTMTAGFRRSTSGPFLTGSPAGWKSVGASGTSGNNGSGSWATTSQQQQQQPTSSGPSAVNGNNGTNNSTVAENAECPSQDALWQSWDLPPLCVVA